MYDSISKLDYIPLQPTTRNELYKLRIAPLRDKVKLNNLVMSDPCLYFNVMVEAFYIINSSCSLNKSLDIRNSRDAIEIILGFDHTIDILLDIEKNLDIQEDGIIGSRQLNHHSITVGLIGCSIIDILGLNISKRDFYTLSMLYNIGLFILADSDPSKYSVFNGILESYSSSKELLNTTSDTYIFDMCRKDITSFVLQNKKFSEIIYGNSKIHSFEDLKKYRPNIDKNSLPLTRIVVLLTEALFFIYKDGNNYIEQIRESLPIQEAVSELNLPMDRFLFAVESVLEDDSSNLTKISRLEF
jgi:HD-like signal output (HDOD) protein